MTYPFRVPLEAIARVRNDVTDQMLGAGEPFWASPRRAAEVMAIGAAVLRHADDDAVISAVAIYADDPDIVRLYEYRAERALIAAWQRGMRSD